MLFIILISISDSPLNVVFGLCLSPSPSRLQVRACIVMQSNDFHNASFIHLLSLFLISYSARSWFILCNIRFLLMASRQLISSILRGQLFANTCTFSVMVMAVLQVTSLYNETVLAFVFENFSFGHGWLFFTFQMFFICKNSDLALLVRTFTSESEPLVKQRCCTDT